MAQFIMHNNSNNCEAIIKSEIEVAEVKYEDDYYMEEMPVEVNLSVKDEELDNSNCTHSRLEEDPSNNCIINCTKHKNEYSCDIVNSSCKMPKCNGKKIKQRKLLCPKCNADFDQRKFLQHHISKSHEPDKLFLCDDCQSMHFQKSRLVLHMKSVHLKIRKYKCEFCGHNFFNSAKLRSHVVMHTGERNYICDYCHKGFRRERNLSQHLRIHQNIRNFLCPICGLAFVQKASLNYHNSKYHKGDSIT